MGTKNTVTNSMLATYMMYQFPQEECGNCSMVMFCIDNKKIAFSALPEVLSIPRSPLNEYGAEKSILALT
jgi:hypothetical protein